MLVGNDRMGTSDIIKTDERSVLGYLRLVVAIKDKRKLTENRLNQSGVEVMREQCVIQ